jgi:hypothetical protein
VHIRIVTFRAPGLDQAQYVEAAGGAAPGFAAWPGLLAKWWLVDPATGTYGGVYLFEDEEAARRSEATPEYATVAHNPAFTDVEIREFATLPELDAVTAGRLPV